MNYDLPTLTRIAQGGQADIYALDDGRILRVLRSRAAGDAAMLRREHAIMSALQERHIDVPRVYEYGEASGHPALAMQRIDGPSMMQQVQRQPLRMGAIADRLAALHASVLACPALPGMQDIKSRARELVPTSQHLDAGDVAFVMGLLDELPAGHKLLHGDFHPGNILIQAGKPYIIDWFGATAGDAVSDVAHTYLLLVDKPQIPGESRLQHRILKFMGKRFADTYLTRVRQHLGFDMDVFGKWMAVRAAERSAYGQPTERQTKAAFVHRCAQAKSKGVLADQWPQLMG